MKQPCVYIMSNKRNGTLYIGVTSNLIQEWKRAWKVQLIEQSNPEWRDLYDGIG